MCYPRSGKCGSGRLGAEVQSSGVSQARVERRGGVPETVPGFCRVDTLDEVLTYDHAPTPGRSVGSEGLDAYEEPFEPRFPGWSSNARRSSPSRPDWEPRDPLQPLRIPQWLVRSQP